MEVDNVWLCSLHNFEESGNASEREGSADCPYAVISVQREQIAFGTVSDGHYVVLRLSEYLAEFVGNSGSAIKSSSEMARFLLAWAFQARSYDTDFHRVQLAQPVGLAVLISSVLVLQRVKFFMCCYTSSIGRPLSPEIKMLLDKKSAGVVL